MYERIETTAMITAFRLRERKEITISWEKRLDQLNEGEGASRECEKTRQK
jgi:hypothetical protein